MPEWVVNPFSTNTLYIHTQTCIRNFYFFSMACQYQQSNLEIIMLELCVNDQNLHGEFHRDFNKDV